ncbi:PREDICTED: uncharacterized protein LOC105457863 [Wasmannia auropunctata]|uniref:uncharacterized protein LOC105457863 n=1 Tax=Wasmannia auropunctata TaxID=64793 RepID=UPI0005EFB053|nr:PREDICTED: uncharacterized protein LOC105457863 [Wasmannia auropunctata]
MVDTNVPSDDDDDNDDDEWDVVGFGATLTIPEDEDLEEQTRNLLRYMEDPEDYDGVPPLFSIGISEEEVCDAGCSGDAKSGDGCYDVGSGGNERGKRRPGSDKRG